MNGAEVERGLNILAAQFRPILDSTAGQVLGSARAQLSTTWRAYGSAMGRRKAVPELAPVWGYAIDASHPLLFRPTTVDRTRLQADIYCKIWWRDPAKLPVELNVVVRVWCLDIAVSHREMFDAVGLRDVIARVGRRVMLRYHFDLAEDDQSGPRFHLQVGGNSMPDETCWLPETISTPRIGHHPLDLALASELVALNFYSIEAGRIFKDATIRGVVRDSQAALLRDYYTWCAQVLQDGNESLLGLTMNPGMIEAVEALRAASSKRS